MSNRFATRQPPVLALNAIRLICPEQPIPAALVPFDRVQLHSFLDRATQDVFATRFAGTNMAVVPILHGAELPAPRENLLAADNMRLFSTLAREAVFRRLLTLPGSYRVVSRRPPIVETAKQENIIPTSVGLPDWLKKRVVLRFETRIIRHPGEAPYLVLICGNRLRTVIDVDCGHLNTIGVPLIGSYVSTWMKDPDPKVAERLRLAGRVVAHDGVMLTLSDHGDGPAELQLQSAYLEPTRANFNAVVQALVQGQAERVLRDLQ